MTDWNKWYSRTDKGYAHNLLVVYEKLLIGVNPKKILEIGVLSGESIRMWHDLFQDAYITGVDIIDCSSLESELDRVSIFRDNAYSASCIKKIGSGFDLIVEDGSHILKHQCFAAENYPYLLADHGVMLIEDIASIEDAHTIQHFIPNEFSDNSYIIDRRGAPCDYPYESFYQRNEILVVIDNRC